MKNLTLFDERKSAQAAAYLLLQAGGTLSVLKLMKLMYLAERESLKRYGDTITGDQFVSMPNGPVLSGTLEHINGLQSSRENGWDTWVRDRSNNDLSLRDVSMVRSADDLLALSETDVECLASVWQQFGHWSAYKLRNYTHTDACPEWEDPLGSSRPIPYARVLKAVGHSSEGVETLTKRLHEQRYINSVLS